MKQRLMEDFQRIYKTQATQMFFSPGRVNLIGEHTDYNGGMVFPCAITCGTYAVIRQREDDRLRLYSNNFKESGIVEVDLQALHNTKDWTTYVKGVFYCLIQAGHTISHGFDILIEGNIPQGAGLSSSASLEMLMAIICKEVYALPLCILDIVKLAQQAENEFVGMHCGIMDQFIIGMGKKDCAIALDSATLQYTYVPVHLEKLCLIIMNTNKKRGLTDSKYNERRAECEHALSQLKTIIDITALCELEKEEFKQYQHVISNAQERKRVKHVVWENARVKQAIEALKADDIQQFGELMNASHVSLRDDYEVTGVALDTLVESAWRQYGVVGARMTGAGFGGCAIAIVHEHAAATFMEQVKREYTQCMGYAPSFTMPSIGDHARQIPMTADRL